MVTRENIAIIIPFHKNVEMLKLSVRTLEESISGKIPQVIIVGNNNNLNELNLPETEFIQYDIYKVPENLFWPRAINFGVEHTDKDYLLFCDPDLFYTENWLDNLMDGYNRHENVGVVSAKIINPLNNRIMDFGMGYNHFNTIHIGKNLPFNHPTTLEDRKVQAACGAVFLTSRELFKKVNGIDTSMPYIYCDNDYSVKIAELGFDTWVVANSIVYYKGNTDSHNSKYENFKYLREDSKAAFYTKNRNKIKTNISECFSYAYNWITGTDFHPQYGYYLYNFCTLMDAGEYIKELAFVGLSVINQKNITLPQRDIAQINLCDYISTRMIYSNMPFIYFVDSFISLYNNELYFKIRDITNDIVIDRQCNMLLLSHIKNKLV